MESKYDDNAMVFKAFCDSKRLFILDILLGGEKCACELIEKTGIAQSALSYHMKILSESGIVESRQVGKWVHYKISQPGGERAKQLLATILGNENV